MQKARSRRATDSAACLQLAGAQAQRVTSVKGHHPCTYMRLEVGAEPSQRVTVERRRAHRRCNLRNQEARGSRAPAWPFRAGLRPHALESDRDPRDRRQDRQGPRPGAVDGAACDAGHVCRGNSLLRDRILHRGLRPAAPKEGLANCDGTRPALGFARLRHAPRRRARLLSDHARDPGLVCAQGGHSGVPTPHQASPIPAELGRGFFSCPYPGFSLQLSTWGIV